MSIKSIISSLLGTGGAHSKDISPEKQLKDVSSGKQAKGRLAFIIAHDRVDIGPGKMDQMKKDMIEVLKKYFDINESQIDLKLENEEGSTALLATIPINSVLGRNGRTARSECSSRK
ncbi:MAG: cell division topological specificity factor MinE [Synergistaceae bacterium]|jgi:cell division topological specificity factor|nr:cell division topological specificity factor MinE [Synergistaceae bacterium]